ELLERMRSDGVAEQRLVVAPAQPIVATVLLVGPSRRKLGGTGDLVVDDRAIADPGPDDRVPALLQRTEQGVEVAPFVPEASGHVDRTLPPSSDRQWKG